MVGRPEKIKTPLGERLREIRRSKGDPEREDFASALDIQKERLARFERGDAVPNADVLARYYDVLGIDLNWLTTGQGSMFGEDKMESSIAKPSDAAASSNHRAIPHFDIRAAAGDGSAEMVVDASSYVVFDHTWFQRYVPPRAVLGVLEVEGDSMVPTLMSGDMVVVNMEERAIREALKQGGIFVFSVRGDFRIKRLQPMINGDLRMISDNPRYETETLDADMVAENLQIQGHLIWSGGPPRHL
jgi:phage repressor protein C with HTH and peptisase S24 domain